MATEKARRWDEKRSRLGDDEFRRDEMTMEMRGQGIYCNPFVHGYNVVKDPPMFSFDITDANPFDDIKRDPRFNDLVKVVPTRTSYAGKVFHKIAKVSMPETALAASWVLTGGIDVLSGAIAIVAASITVTCFVGEYTVKYFWPQDQKLKTGTKENVYKIGDVSTTVAVTVYKGSMTIRLDMKDMHSDAYAKREYSFPIFMGIAFLKCLFIYVDNPITGVFSKEGEVCHCYDLDEIRDNIVKKKNVVNKGVILGKYAFLSNK